MILNTNVPVTDYAVVPAVAPTLPIEGRNALFPVRRIYCVGRNYAEHAMEMGHDPSKELPFFFQKSGDTITTDGRFPYPPGSADVQYEVELIVALKSGGTDIPVESALDCVFGYGIGLDMTRRDLQAQAKKMGRPWEVGKSFEASAPCSPLYEADQSGHPSRGAISLSINGVRQQSGDLDQMIWKVPEIISYLSSLFALAPGDLIMTGTPAGVGPVVRGDVMTASIAGMRDLIVRVI